MVWRSACLALAAFFSACQPPAPSVPASPDAASPPAAIAAAPVAAQQPAPPATGENRWAAMRAVEAECDACHPDESTAWRASQMGRSLLAYGSAHPPPRVEASTGEFLHTRTGLRYGVRVDATGRPIFLDGTSSLAAADGPPVERPADYLIGSGAHTRSYLWVAGDAVFEAPLTWYTSRHAWGPSPGYDVPDQPGLYREVGPDCLLCHADPAPFRPGSLNRYDRPAPGPLGCTRCHGDSRAHVKARQDNRKTDDPVNPPKLSPDRRGDVCDQCHLQGAVRIARDGRVFGEFLPGEVLSDSVAVFFRENAGQTFGIASHGERLRRSRCGHGTLTCTQCHAPHDLHAPKDRSAPCRQCHGERHRACSGGGGPDCVGCHMHRAQTADIPHVAMTDHNIRVHPEAEGLLPPKSMGELFRVGLDPAAAGTPEERLLLGRAYAEAARVGNGDVAHDRDRALELLVPALAVHPESVEGWSDLASMRQLLGDRPGVREALQHAFSLRPGDVRIARSTASARFGDGDYPGALAAADGGLQTEPESVPLLLLRANILAALGRRDEAATALGTASRLRPGDAEVLLAQGVRAELSRDLPAAERAYTTATRHGPLNVPAWLSRFRTSATLGHWRAAQEAADGALAAVHNRGPVPDGLNVRLTAAHALAQAQLGQLGPAATEAVGLLTLGLKEPWAAHAMAVVSLKAGKPDAALQFLDQAVSWAPEDGPTWATLALALRKTGKPDLADRARLQARRFGVPDPDPRHP